MPFVPTDFTNLSVTVSDMLVATADGYDAAMDGPITEVLRALRQQFGMDVVFVSEFIDGKRVFRFVDRTPESPEIKVGDGSALEQSYCQHVVDGRLPKLIHDVASLPQASTLPPVPFRVGAHLSTPITISGGRTYGTLCCFSTAPNPQLQQRDLDTLRMCAQLVARKIEAADDRGEKAGWAPAPTGPKTGR